MSAFNRRRSFFFVFREILHSPLHSSWVAVGKQAQIGFCRRISPRGYRCCIALLKLLSVVLTLAPRKTPFFPYMRFITMPNFHAFLSLSSPWMITADSFRDSAACFPALPTWRSSKLRTYSLDHHFHIACLHCLRNFARVRRSWFSKWCALSSGRHTGLIFNIEFFVNTGNSISSSW